MNETKIICPRCGAEMDINARCCIKCGNLNVNNMANQNMMPYIQQNQTTTYQIGSGQVIAQDVNSNKGIANNTGNKTICFILNFSLFLIIILASFLLSINGEYLSIVTIKNSVFPYMAFLFSLVFLNLYGWQLVYMKCNKPWWSFLIPIYNLMILGEILYGKKWIGLLTLVPVIGQIVLLVMIYTLAKKFKYSGLLTIIFAWIMIPLMGFGSHFYDNIDYVDENHTLEMSYKKNKVFLSCIVFFFITGLVFIFWNNILEVKSGAQKISNYYYLYATNKTIDKTKQLAKENYLNCDNQAYSNNSGVYYIQYADVGDRVFLPFYFLKDESISAYVIVDNNSGESKYYISMGDGEYGYPETLYDNVTIETIGKYKDFDFKDRDSVNFCEITKSTVHNNVR